LESSQKFVEVESSQKFVEVESSQKFVEVDLNFTLDGNHAGQLLGRRPHDPIRLR